MFQQGVTLKQLLENPELLNPPKNTDPVASGEKLKLKEDGGSGSIYGGQGMFAGQSAFLGPNIWDKSAGPNGEDFNLEYMDLDEFLVENCVDDKMLASTFGSGSPQSTSPQSQHCYSPQPQGAGTVAPGGPLSLSPMHSANSPMSHMSPVLSPPAPDSPTTHAPIMHQQQQQQQHSSELAKYLNPSPLQTAAPLSPTTPLDITPPQTLSPPQASPKAVTSTVSSTVMERTQQSYQEYDDESCDGEEEDYNGLFTPNNIALGQGEGQDEFDPRKRKFTEEELRPQPMIKKSRKVYVPDESKDDKYWMRRKKNNTAAKRSRDARRVKENQIALRAAFLEKQAATLRVELAASEEENRKLRQELSQYKKK